MRRTSPFLQNSEQLGLDIGRNFADLVQEERPAAGLLEETGVRTHGTGERTAIVSEQLALEDSRCECCAVDRHEGGVRARAEAMEIARQDFLADTAVAGDEDAHTRIVECEDEIPQALGRRR